MTNFLHLLYHRALALPDYGSQPLSTGRSQSETAGAAPSRQCTIQLHSKSQYPWHVVESCAIAHAGF